MRIRCPSCRAQFSLDVACAGAGAERMVATIAGQPRALLEYVSLFRPAKTTLSWERAAKIAEDACALAREVDAPSDRFEHALMATIAGIRAKVADGTGSLPITSHGYLKRVLAARAEDKPAEPDDTPAVDWDARRRQAEEQAEAAARERLSRAGNLVKRPGRGR